MPDFPDAVIVFPNAFHKHAAKLGRIMDPLIGLNDLSKSRDDDLDFAGLGNRNKAFEIPFIGIESLGLKRSASQIHICIRIGRWRLSAIGDDIMRAVITSQPRAERHKQKTLFQQFFKEPFFVNKPVSCRPAKVGIIGRKIRIRVGK